MARDEETRRKHAEYMRAYYATHPEARERKNAKDRERYQRRRAERLAHVAAYYQEHKEERREYGRKYSKNKRDRRRAAAMAKLGDCCRDCGFDNPAGLQFHHRISEEKLFEVGGAGLTKPEADFWAEVEKCDLLCGTCHLLRHAEEDR